jgi:putative flippase GtrA
MLDVPPIRPPIKGRLGHEVRMVLKYTCVALIGFTTDALLLQLCLWLGLSPAQARVISLGVAMQVTFLVNGLVVFKTLERRRALRQWLRYMLSNAVGNLANYFVFLAWVSSRLPFFSNHLAALAAGGTVAWVINYASTRWLVFHHGRPAIVWPWKRTPKPACDPETIVCED